MKKITASILTIAIALFGIASLSVNAQHHDKKHNDKKFEMKHDSSQFHRGPQFRGGEKDGKMMPPPRHEGKKMPMAPKHMPKGHHGQEKEKSAHMLVLPPVVVWG